MSFRRSGLAMLSALLVTVGLAPSALAADPTPLNGNPLTIHVGERGQLQAFRNGAAPCTPGAPLPCGIFFHPTSTSGDAGFFLAFPDGAAPASLTGTVYGFGGSAGPSGLVDYTTISQGPTTGSGSAADPLTQVTSYSVDTGGSPVLEVTQTTTYVNGSQQFSMRWVVHNVTGALVKFKALSAADFFFDGSDRGTGIFTEGPPRFVGGTNADTGNSGGFAEVTGSSPSPPWSAYQALEWGGGSSQVWGKVQGSASTAEATFDNTVVGESVDNAGGVEWDKQEVGAGATRTFELTARSAVPAALQLNPTNAGSPRGVPIHIAATAVNTDGVPYAGRTLRWTINGVNPGTGSAVLAANGSATITDPGANAGNDTIVAFVDFNGDGSRQSAEPQASALATFVDNVAPSCTVKVSGDRPGGGGAGKPLVITVNCNEPATVTTSTTLQTIPSGASSAKADAAAKKKRKKPVKIKLKQTVSTVAPGQAVPIKIAIPRKVAKKYAGKTLKATVTVSARDKAGNVKQVKATKKIKLAKIKKKARRRG